MSSNNSTPSPQPPPPLPEHNDESLLSSIACEACRRSHKRCDRSLPSCSKCVSRNVECNYVEPKKRGKASETYKKNKKQKQEKPEHLVGQVIDFYFTFVCAGHPVLSRAKLEYFTVEYLSSFESGDEIEFEMNDLIQMREELDYLYVFFLSMKSIYYQYSCELQSASQAMSLCEKRLGKYLTQSFHLYIYGTCQLIAIYYSGVGDFAKVNFYGSLVTFYIGHYVKNTTDHFEKNLARRDAFFFQYMSELESDAVSLFIERVPKIFEVTVDQKLEDILVPGALDYLKVAPVTLQNYMFFKQVLDFVFKVVEQFRIEMCKNMKDCSSEKLTRFAQICRNLTYFGFHLNYLTKLPNFSTDLEEVALKISCVTESEYFICCTAEMIRPVRNAAQVHLNICKQIENGVRENNLPFVTSTGKVLNIDYFSILEKDLKALTCMEKKFQRVSATCGEMIKEISAVLQNHYLKQVNALSSTAQALSLPALVVSNLHVTPQPSQTTNNEGDAKWISLMKYLDAIKERIGSQTKDDIFLDFEELLK